MTPTLPMTAPPRSRSHRPAVRALAGATVALLVAGATALVAGDDSRATSSTAAAASPVSAQLVRLERATRSGGDDPQAWAALGAAYVDHARANSDPSAYPKAERALDRALALDARSWEALGALGALAAGRHDFRPALDASRRALALQPSSSFIHAVVVDSLTELGRYDEAVDATQAMVDLRPDLASYARVSYQRELHGDVDGAVEAMELALRSSSTAGDRAFALFHLGQLEWDRGALDRAAARFRDALRADPTAVQADAGLGRIAAARGDVDGAIVRYERAVDAFPDPELLKELGELHLVAGRRDHAEAQFRRADASNAAQAAGGVDVNLEVALFSADHRRELDTGLAAAQEEWNRRHSIHVADALAWQLFQHGRNREALEFADEALKLGTRSASFHFHRAEIHRSLGNRAAAKADYEQTMALNPNFSVLHHGAAQRALVALG